MYSLDDYGCVRVFLIMYLNMARTYPHAVVGSSDMSLVRGHVS